MTRGIAVESECSVDSDRDDANKGKYRRERKAHSLGKREGTAELPNQVGANEWDQNDVGVKALVQSVIYEIKENATETNDKKSDRDPERSVP